MKPLKVAIVMGGGVSLGSFSGGALSAALRRLDREARDAGMRMQIDVLSGASAGAISLCLLLRKLAWPDEAHDPEDDASFWSANVERPQHRAWVEESGIEQLAGGAQEARASLLSSEALDGVAAEMMSWRQGRAPGRSRFDPRGLLAPRVHLVATLMNLNGVPVVSKRLEGNPALVDATAATLYQDLRVYCLDLADEPGPETPPPWPRSLRRTEADLRSDETWREIAGTCLAAGAFPIAFEPRPIRRERHELGPLWPWGGGADEASPALRALRRKLWFEDREEFAFTYGDGGAFNNEPLAEAMELIRHVDRRGGDGDFHRVLLFIDPHLSGTAHNEFLELHYPTAIEAGAETERTLGRKLLLQAGSMAAAIAGQAGFRDVRQADRINERLAWRHDARRIVRQLVDALPDDRVGELVEETTAALGRVLEIKEGASLGGGDYPLTEELERVRLEEESAAAEESGGLEPRHLAPHEPGTRNQLRRTLLSLLDQISGLRDRRSVEIIAVGPVWHDGLEGEPVTIPLAGGLLRRFGGFLDEDFRRHDFEWGLLKGDQVRLRQDGTGAPARADRAPPPPPEAIPAPPGEAAYHRARARLVATARARYAELLRSLGGDDDGGFLRSVGSFFRSVPGYAWSFVRTGSREGPLMRLFDKEIAPRLARSVGEASARRVHVRVRIRIEDGLGSSGPSYRLRPGSAGGRESAADWTSRRAGAAEVGSWAEVAIRFGGDGAARWTRTLEITRGPHFHESEGAEAAGGRGPFLVVDLADDGRVAPALPIRLPLGPDSAFFGALERRIHLLERSQQPLLEARVALRNPPGSGPPGVTWAPVPNV